MSIDRNAPTYKLSTYRCEEREHPDDPYPVTIACGYIDRVSFLVETIEDVAALRADSPLDDPFTVLGEEGKSVQQLSLF